MPQTRKKPSVHHISLSDDESNDDHEDDEAANAESTLRAENFQLIKRRLMQQSLLIERFKTIKQQNESLSQENATLYEKIREMDRELVELRGWKDRMRRDIGNLWRHCFGGEERDAEAPHGAGLGRRNVAQRHEESPVSPPPMHDEPRVAVERRGQSASAAEKHTTKSAAPSSTARTSTTTTHSTPPKKRPKTIPSAPQIEQIERRTDHLEFGMLHGTTVDILDDSHEMPEHGSSHRVDTHMPLVPSPRNQQQQQTSSTNRQSQVTIPSTTTLSSSDSITTGDDFSKHAPTHSISSSSDNDSVSDVDSETKAIEEEFMADLYDNAEEEMPAQHEYVEKACHSPTESESSRKRKRRDESTFQKKRHRIDTTHYQTPAHLRAPEVDLLRDNLSVGDFVRRVTNSLFEAFAEYRTQVSFHVELRENIVAVAHTIWYHCDSKYNEVVGALFGVGAKLIEQRSQSIHMLVDVFVALRSVSKGALARLCAEFIRAEVLLRKGQATRELHELNVLTLFSMLSSHDVLRHDYLPYFYLMCTDLVCNREEQFLSRALPLMYYSSGEHLLQARDGVLNDSIRFVLRRSLGAVQDGLGKYFLEGEQEKSVETAKGTLQEGDAQILTLQPDSVVHRIEQQISAHRFDVESASSVLSEDWCLVKSVQVLCSLLSWEEIFNRVLGEIVWPLVVQKGRHDSEPNPRVLAFVVQCVGVVCQLQVMRAGRGGENSGESAKILLHRLQLILKVPSKPGANVPLVESNQILKKSAEGAMRVLQAMTPVG